MIERDQPMSSPDLVAAIEEFEKSLVGWWYTLGKCRISRDASCGPESTGPDADLLACRKFDNGFSVDNYDEGSTLADALRQVLEIALKEREAARVDGWSCIINKDGWKTCTCEATAGCKGTLHIRHEIHIDVRHEEPIIGIQEEEEGVRPCKGHWTLNESSHQIECDECGLTLESFARSYKHPSKENQ